MDDSMSRVRERPGRRRTLAIVLALAALAVLTLAWLLAAPAAGALGLGGLPL